ncbi:hypothetical protein GOV11_00700 [Candidatus Woesearchaeota archaeon]|nr:hypothetical protein [Candidatus Woesearchaeota archaeon]
MGKGGGEIKQRMLLLAQEQERRKEMNALRRDTVRRINFLQKKAVVETHDVYNLIRGFFKRFLNKHYEFTITELRAELKQIYISANTRKAVEDILNSLEAIEYANVHYRREELMKLLDEFSESVKQLVHMHKMRKSMWLKLREFFLRHEIEPEFILADLPMLEESDDEYIRIHLLVENCYEALDGRHIHRAKAAYKALLKKYHDLPMDERRRFYTLVDQTYQDIINRSKKD